MDPHPVPALQPHGMDGYREVRFERTHDGQVGVITWQSKRMNPLSVELSNELVAAVEEAYADETLKVVVLRGLGGFFSVGDDLVEMHEGAWGDPNQVMRRIRFYQRFANTIEELDKVTIAVAEGFVLGGGLEITMACDFVLAADGCKWGMPEVDSGMTPGWGGTTRMIRLIGRRRAKEVNMIGAIHSAARAVDWGLFNRAVPESELEDEVERLVQLMLTKNQQTMRQLKFVLNKNADTDVQTALAFEAMNEVITSAVNWRSDTPPVPDAEPGKGLEAFAEKNDLWERRRGAAVNFWSG
jgi:enoyl-CoA hydratase/carnithine racemase